MKRLDKTDYEYLRTVVQKLDFKKQLKTQIQKLMTVDKRLLTIVEDNFDYSIDVFAYFLGKHTHSSTMLFAVLDARWRVDAEIEVDEDDEPVTDMRRYFRENVTINDMHSAEFTEFDIIDLQKNVEYDMLPYEVYLDCFDLAA